MDSLAIMDDLKKRIGAEKVGGEGTYVKMAKNRGAFSFIGTTKWLTLLNAGKNN